MQHYSVPKCHLCESTRIKIFLRDGKFTIRQCLGCAYKFTWPQPTETELREIYGRGYFKNENARSMAYDDYASEENDVRTTSKIRLKHIAKELNITQGRVLDIGCAMGFFLAACEEKGFETFGVELSEFCQEHWKAKTSHVHWGTLETASFENGFFDLITLWDVIEHVPDPRLLLSICARLLKPGGGLVLMTPNIDSFIAKVMKEKWVCYEDPHIHLHYYGEKHIRTELERCGFDKIRVRTFWHGGKYVPLRLVFERFGKYFPKGRKLTSRLENSLLASRTSYLDIGDNMVVYANRTM